MLHAQLILMLKLLQLLLRRNLILLLILVRGLHGLLDILADEKNLAVFVVEVLGLHGTPSQAAELLDDPVLRLATYYHKYRERDKHTLWETLGPQEVGHSPVQLARGS